MLNKLLTDNYKEILIAAKRITRKRDVKLAPVLINETFLHIAEEKKTYPTDNIGFVMYYSRYMKLMFLGERSRFSKAERFKELEIIEVYEPEDETALNEMDLNSEEINEATRDVLDNLSHLRISRLNRYMDVVEFEHSLPSHLKDIFDMHYRHGMSSRDIARNMEIWSGYKMDYRFYNGLINEVKQLIKDKWLN